MLLLSDFAGNIRITQKFATRESFRSRQVAATTAPQKFEFMVIGACQAVTPEISPAAAGELFLRSG
jgi:hypothetical protein